MQDTVKQRVLPFALCAISLGIGVFCGAAGARSQREKQLEPASQVLPTATNAPTDDSTVKVLRARIRALEAQLAERGSGDEAKDEPAEAPVPEAAVPSPNPQPWIDEMKKKHPERYVAMTNHIANFRRMQREQASEKMGFLSAIDPSSLGEEAKEVHERLQELLAQREELSERAFAGMDRLTREERNEFFRQQGEIGREIAELNDKERANLVRQLATNLGFGEEDSGEIVETVKQIIEATESNFDHPPRLRREGLRR